MWYIGVALAFIAGYLYHRAHAEAIALVAAAVAASYLGEYLSAMRKSTHYKRKAERAQVRMAGLYLEAEEVRRGRELAEQHIQELKGEVSRLRDRLPAEEEQREKIERIITQVEEEL